MHSKYQMGVVAGILGLGLIAAGCGHEGGSAAAGASAAQQQPPPNVVVAAAESRDVPVYIDAIGKTVAVESVTITPRIAGQIVERRFQDGADVKKGQVLFMIDPLPSQAALASAQAQLQQSRAAEQLAKIEFERYGAVAGTNAISKSDYDVKKNAVDVAAAQIAAAEAAVHIAQINLDFCTIASPIDGRAGSRMVDVGNVVKANETPLLSVQSVDPIYADFTVNEQQLADVRANMAGGTLVAHVRVPSDSGEGAVGELTFLDNSVQTTTGTIRLRATLKNADRHFWPGQFVNVRLVLKTLKGAVLVPAKASQVGQGGPFLLVVKPDHTAEQRDVVIGQQQGDLVVIEKGIAAGEQVITEGQLMVRPGGPVTVVPAGAAPTTGNAAAGAVPDARSSPAATGPATEQASPTSTPATQDQGNNAR